MADEETATVDQTPTTESKGKAAAEEDEDEAEGMEIDAGNDAVEGDDAEADDNDDEEDDDDDDDEDDEDEDEDEDGDDDDDEEAGPADATEGTPKKKKKAASTPARLRQELARQEKRRLRKLAKERKAALDRMRMEQNRDVEKGADQLTKNRFKFLLSQTEIFSHFLKGAPPPSGGGKKAGDGGTRRNRMTEDEEDKELSKNNFVGTRLTVQPSCIKNGTMKGYQLEGLNWLIKLYENGINGILADEMGLGKTLQTISILGYLKEQRGINGPHLIVVPKSTTGNWMNEIERWCPSLRAIKLQGGKEERAEIVRTELVVGTFDVLVTSYEVAIIEKSALCKFSWCYLVVDEAHRIKNEESKLSQILRLFSTQHRLLVTGTPLQNNLHELWALLNFLLPDVFGSADMFDEWFDLSSGENADKQAVVNQLHKVLRPFLLRRLKTDVVKDLPPKTETLLYVPISDMQRMWYKNLVSKNIDAINSNVKSQSKTRLQNIMMQLRKCANHPYLFEGAEPGPPYTTDQHLVDNAGKMVVLDKLLPKLYAEGSRVLIFSQMTRVLDILEDYLNWKGHQYCRIDGSTHGDARDDAIDSFNADGSEKFVFLLSTRAGGLGINLYTANVVILFDSDWNPQADLQAMDRAHRIGQKKPVQVFRLITEDTVEEKILERATMKLHLDAIVIQQGRLVENKTLKKDEIMSMIKFGADKIIHASDSLMTDESIDEIINRGRAATEKLNNQFAAKTESLLSSFSQADSISLYEFEGKNYRDENASLIGISGSSGLSATAGLIDLGKRERRGPDSYNDSEYYREALRVGEPSKPKAPRPAKQPQIHDFQMYPQELTDLLERETWSYRFEYTPSFVNTYLEGKEDWTDEEKAAEKERLKALEKLTDEEKELRNTLIEEAGFGDWSRRDYQQFLRGCERYGREAYDQIAADVDNKDADEVRRYAEAFFSKGAELIGDYERAITNIEKGEAKIERLKEIADVISAKISRSGRNPWQTLKVNYGSSRGNAFTEEEDRFLFCMTAQVGYGNFDEVVAEVRKAWEFRFDWFLKSRTAVEIQRRVDQLVRLVEKEPEEVKRKAMAVVKSRSKKGSKKGSSKASGSKRKRSSSTKSPKKKASSAKRSKLNSGRKKSSAAASSEATD